MVNSFSSDTGALVARCPGLMRTRGSSVTGRYQDSPMVPNQDLGLRRD
jgi:hypothetical protein